MFQAVWTAGTLVYISTFGTEADVKTVNAILSKLATYKSLTQGVEYDSLPPALLLAQYPERFSRQTVEILATKFKYTKLQKSRWPLGPIVTFALARHAFNYDSNANINLLHEWSHSRTVTSPAVVEKLIHTLAPSIESKPIAYESELSNLKSDVALSRKLKSIVNSIEFDSAPTPITGVPISNKTRAAIEVAGHDIHSWTGYFSDFDFVREIHILFSDDKKNLQPEYNLSLCTKSISSDSNLLRKYFDKILAWEHDGQLASLAHILQYAQMNVESFTFVLEKVASDQTDEFTSYEVTSLVRNVLDYKTVPEHFSNAAFEIVLRRTLGALQGVLGNVLRAILRWNDNFKVNSNGYSDAVAKCTIASWALGVHTKESVPEYCLIFSNDWNTSVTTLIAQWKYNTAAGSATDMVLAKYELDSAGNLIDNSESFSNKLYPLLAFTLVFLLLCAGVYAARVFIKRDLAKESAPADAGDDPSSQKASTPSEAVSANSREEKLP